MGTCLKHGAAYEGLGCSRCELDSLTAERDALKEEVGQHVRLLARLIEWVDHPALVRVCSIASAHGMGITEDESRDGHAALSEARALVNGGG